MLSLVSRTDGQRRTVHQMGTPQANGAFHRSVLYYTNVTGALTSARPQVPQVMLATRSESSKDQKFY